MEIKEKKKNSFSIYGSFFESSEWATLISNENSNGFCSLLCSTVLLLIRAETFVLINSSLKIRVTILLAVTRETHVHLAIVTIVFYNSK